MNPTIRQILGLPPTLPSVTDSILVIIDAQGEYAEGLLKVEHADASRAVIRVLLDRYRAAAGSVIHVVADSPAGAPIFTPGTSLAAILPELTPAAGEPVVHKVHASAFTGTTFEAEIRKTQKKKLVVVGYMVRAKRLSPVVPVPPLTTTGPQLRLGDGPRRRRARLRRLRGARRRGRPQPAGRHGRRAGPRQPGRGRRRRGHDHRCEGCAGGVADVLLLARCPYGTPTHSGFAFPVPRNVLASMPSIRVPKMTHHPSCA